jgi:hypothetical protein
LGWWKGRERTHGVSARVVEATSGESQLGEEGKGHRKSDCGLHGDYMWSVEQRRCGLAGAGEQDALRTLSFILV